jgi:hypothetical protein
MDLSVLSTLAGAISAIAVLVSLLLVQRQIRQSEKNQRALIQQGRAGRSAEIAMRLMDSDFARAYHGCMNGDMEITEIELVQFIGYCRAVFLGAEDSFLQHREGLLDEPAFNSFKRALLGLFVSPGMRASWSVLREWYDPEFAAYVDCIIEDTADRPNAFQHDRWMAAASVEIVRKRAA